MIGPLTLRDEPVEPGSLVALAEEPAINDQEVRQGDRWIVSAHDFCQHKSLYVAEAEARRLQQQFPEKTFRVYRIKARLRAGNYVARERRVRDLEAEVARLTALLDLAESQVRGE